ncbi:DUF3726 domain-containing protein [Nioella nitratireducens]|uniref:DUF3726 domain-containing protein n=1 Tax=Nioella nitratireducens TaxID=1287720 RepID=UPI0008FD201B|nr:DUF3726 domain-containing protein [Nioella nitratireducens]
MTPTWSLNELEALSRKAARGAGYSWGLSEEAGRATRWLCARGLAGAEALVRLLDWRDLRDHDATVPMLHPQHWQAAPKGTCPIVAGTLLSDGVGEVSPLALHLQGVQEPLLLLPFVAWRAEAAGDALSVSFDGLRYVTRPDGHLLRSAEAGSAHDGVEVSAVAAPRGTPIMAHTRAEVAPETMQRLTAFATRTYAPATEASRLAGAGAGLSDND